MSTIRRSCIQLLSVVIARSGGVRITDPTSGFRAIRSPLLDAFAQRLPAPLPGRHVRGRARRLATRLSHRRGPGQHAPAPGWPAVCRPVRVQPGHAARLHRAVHRHHVRSAASTMNDRTARLARAAGPVRSADGGLLDVDHRHAAVHVARRGRTPVQGLRHGTLRGARRRAAWAVDQHPPVRRAQIDGARPTAPTTGCSATSSSPTCPAACAVGNDGATISTAAVYPPFWYAVVGGGGSRHGPGHPPTRVPGRQCAAVRRRSSPLAFESARRSRQSSLSPLLLIGLTPMTVFLAGTLNPNGFEIAGFVLGLEPVPAPRRARVRPRRAPASWSVAWSPRCCCHASRRSCGSPLGAVVAAVLLGLGPASAAWDDGSSFRRSAARRRAVVALAAWSGTRACRPTTRARPVDWPAAHVIRETDRSVARPDRADDRHPGVARHAPAR